jgi:hypothetical protein
VICWLIVCRIWRAIERRSTCRGGGAIRSMAFVSIAGKSAALLRNDLVRDVCYGLAEEADVRFAARSGRCTVIITRIPRLSRHSLPRSRAYPILQTGPQRSAPFCRIVDESCRSGSRPGPLHPCCLAQVRRSERLRTHPVFAITAISREGFASVLVTHQARFASESCDREGALSACG